MPEHATGRDGHLVANDRSVSTILRRAASTLLARLYRAYDAIAVPRNHDTERGAQVLVTQSRDV